MNLSKISLLTLGLLSLLSISPALAGSPYYSCSWKGSMSQKGKAQTPLSFTGYLHIDAFYGLIDELFQGNAPEAGGITKLRGNCNAEDGCWLERKTAKGAMTYFEFDVQKRNSGKDGMVTSYKGIWGYEEEAADHLGDFSLEQTCKPIQAASDQAFKSFVTEKLGWERSNF